MSAARVEGLLEVRVDYEAETAIIGLRGDLDLATAEVLESTLQAIEAGNVRGIVLDLSELEFCDSTGLAVIMRAITRGHENGDRLSLLRPNAQVERLFLLTGLEEQVPFVD